nr:unnamed protein product [Fasciola hepatica]
MEAASASNTAQCETSSPVLFRRLWTERSSVCGASTPDKYLKCLAAILKFQTFLPRFDTYLALPTAHFVPDQTPSVELSSALKGF